MTYTPYRMYLFISDEDTLYERNVLYDTYEVKVTRADGSVLTSYEACRYTDLKIPADGVLTAGYGSLQGFNFGYNHGFSYAQSFYPQWPKSTVYGQVWTNYPRGHLSTGGDKLPQRSNGTNYPRGQREVGGGEGAKQ